MSENSSFQDARVGDWLTSESRLFHSTRQFGEKLAPELIVLARICPTTAGIRRRLLE